MLKWLITNARAAVVTLDAVNNLKKGHPIIKLQGCIGAVIQIVIGRTDNPWFPEFGTLLSLEEGERVKVKRQAQGVMDLHVEASSAEDGRVSTDFVDDEAKKTKRSVSITPAMSMLLYNLLGVDATIYDNWDGLEVTTALHAVYLETLSNSTTQEKGVCLARLTKAVPPPKATKRIHIPSQADTPTIFINGEKAPFCDVITNFRGLQAKHTKNGEEYDLFLGEELQKWGLLKTELSEVMLSGQSVDPPADDATDDEQSMEASADDDCEEEVENEVSEAAATAKDNGAGAGSSSTQANTDKDKGRRRKRARRHSEWATQRWVLFCTLGRMPLQRPPKMRMQKRATRSPRGF
ncbi:hypothetical protein SEMRO_2737_G335940.1 [Seminavis robusta]|uniref:Uncharacterized protein n=1 Tax=Seminavis robusta TaxID=568900 RepID=A0A9N8EZT8_9STRA|nr:hypothetical protein SEMRO_2737_G335940.1 [Seminavis robusta]|eukprot:Sro2737_g335940.1 n/a (350) ;mRNA; r:6013-7154